VRMVCSVQRLARIGGLVLLGAGILVLAWVILVWRWEDPFTALYTTWEQHKLTQRYDKLLADRPPAHSAQLAGRGASSTGDTPAIAAEAAAFRRETHAGEPIGRIVVGRLGLNMILVDGTDHDSLTKGPGRDLRTYMPGQNRLVYIAGHRTTYLAPFAHINDIRRGDYIRLEMPYGTFVYRAVKHEIVPADAMWMLRSPHHELLRLQACHPRFFATHRYIVDARLVAVEPPVRRT
jgi:sortase A